MIKNVCELCVHYKKVSWHYGSFGCGKAITRDGGNGYGPFYSRAACVHDKHAPTLENLFESVKESDLLRANKFADEQKEKIYKLESTIKELEWSVVNIAKGKNEQIP
jgi:hypothetical protein